MRTYADRDVAIVGVPARDTEEAMRDFVARHGLGDMPHAVDLDLEIWSKFDVPAQPAWVFVNQDGSVSRVLGMLGDEGIASEIDALLAR